MESQADGGSTTAPVSNGEEVPVSEAAMRQNMIDTELNGMIAEMMKSEDFEDEDEMDPESYEPLMRAAKEICYTRKIYDVSADKIVYFPSVIKTIVNYDLFEKAEKYYFEEDDEYPSDYAMGLRSVAFERLEAEQEANGDDDDDDEMDDDMMERLSMAVQLTENDLDELAAAVAAAEAEDEEEAKPEIDEKEDSTMDVIPEAETSSEPVASSESTHEEDKDDNLDVAAEQSDAAESTTVLENESEQATKTEGEKSAKSEDAPASIELQSDPTDESIPKGNSTSSSVSKGEAVPVSEAAMRQNMIDTELNGMIAEMVKSEDFEDEDEMDPESYEPLMRAAKEICYTRKIYDVSADKIVYFPSVIKTIVNYDLFEKAEKYYFEEDDEYPSDYAMGLRSVAFERLEAEQEANGDDDDEMDDDMMERLSMAVQLTENDLDELAAAVAAAEAEDEEEAEQHIDKKEDDSAMDMIPEAETPSKPVASTDIGEVAPTPEVDGLDKLDQAPDHSEMADAGSTKPADQQGNAVSSVAEELAALKNRSLTKNFAEKFKDAGGLSTPEEEQANLRKVSEANRAQAYKKEATETLNAGFNAVDQDLSVKQKQIEQKKEDSQKQEEAAENLKRVNAAKVASVQTGESTQIVPDIASDSFDSTSSAQDKEGNPTSVEFSGSGKLDQTPDQSDMAEGTTGAESVSEEATKTEKGEEKQVTSASVQFESSSSLDDALYYSDDSESLSDAYFHPTTSDGKKSYGSIDQHRSPSYEPNQPPILEDSPVTQSSPLLLPTSDYGTKRKRDSRRTARRQHQEDREREVTRIRGEVQSPTTYHGMPWTILFVIQLLFVFACAVIYGLTLLKPASTTMSGGRRLSKSGFVQNMLLETGNNDDINGTKISQAIKNTSSNSTILHSKDMKNLQDDDYILSQTASITKVVSTKQTKGQTQGTHLGNLSDPTSANPKLFRIDYRNVISIFSVSGCYACVISYLAFGVILSLARSVIPVILIFSIVFAFCWSMFGLALFPHSSSTMFGFVGLFLALGYSMASWNRIPFCSINLYTAMCALRDTRGVLFIGIGSLLLVFTWLLIWLVAMIGIFNTSNAEECQLNTVDCRTHLVMEGDRYFELAILLFSFVWTSIVIKNVVRTTIAGACGAWWFGLHEQSHGWACFNSIIWSQLAQSCSYSFGSICFGSLVEVPVQLLSLLGRMFCSCTSRSSDQGQEATGQGFDPNKSLNSVSSWEPESTNMFARIAHLIRCCNRWCYTYIGMFSYSYLEGGEKAYQLFSTRGWMVIAEDNLVRTALTMTSIVIGASCGIVAVLVEEVDGYTFTSLHQPIWTSFWIGSVTGFVLSNILLLGVVGSAINTVLVCFAAEPFAFDQNHPRLSAEMRGVWSALVWEAPPPESSSNLLNAGNEQTSTIV